MPVTSPALVDVTSVPVTLAEVEAFFTLDALLLDEWRLDEWKALVAPDARYLIPPLSQPQSSPEDTLFLVSDDHDRLHSRLKQLQGNAAWAESPRSRTRRLVTNARILQADGDEVDVAANFAVWRFQNDQTDVFVGRYFNKLVRTSSGLLMRERKAVLDLETLRPHGTISFIL
jgi:p-cumate 2,3-dioxygenase subunit beta